jgi:hypothetical protein
VGITIGIYEYSIIHTHPAGGTESALKALAGKICLSFKIFFGLSTVRIEYRINISEYDGKYLVMQRLTWRIKYMARTIP